MKKSKRNKNPRPAQLSCHAPQAQAVSVAGTFHDRYPAATPLARDASGDWDVHLDLPPGRHESKFVVDGTWCCEPGCDGPHHGCPKCVPNPSGTMNRVVDNA
ncbi:glycogen-binding domain-containing protein [Tautonia sociabilis]|uniref:Glycoside hydrolase family 13 n=1 Tax=Tautonia sociabilis TaxID=2080755 RepID=A0A432MI41_9BACT|nr:glycogen-binding domain-containing protein [Tautonia sociabilis]RUL87041.1 glycoside hydrolase family 13 [Tautonia sociabilis]